MPQQHAKSSPNWGQRPVRKAADLEKFVHGGKDEVRLNVQVPRSLRAHIKSWCALHGREIQDVMNEILRDPYVQRKYFPAK